jgi:hypothetical protein
MLKLNLLEYDTKGYYDEMFDENNNVRPINYFKRLQKSEL